MKIYEFNQKYKFSRDIGQTKSRNSINWYTHENSNFKLIQLLL